MATVNRFLAAVSISIICCALIAASPGDDPRCADHVCAFVPPFPGSEFLGDPSACGYGECPKCLVGPEWEARKQELGVGRATRSFVPSIQFDNWISANVAQTIFRILAEEAMSFVTEPTPGYSNGYDILCCERDIINLEGWPADPMPDDEGYFSLSLTSVGYEGGAGLFVPKHTADKYPLATSYNAYKYLPEYQNIFPKGYSTPCIEATVNKTLGCVEGNYECNLNLWTNTTCAPQGRYVPPQCEADPTSCQEVFFAYSYWESGWFEGLIKNTGLKMIVVYLGYDGLVERISSAIAAGQHSMFYWSEPDPGSALFGAQRVVFPQPTQSCLERANSDPTLNKAACDFPKRPLAKRARRSSLDKDADFKYFFESFSISTAQIDAMMGQHTLGGGTMDVYNISCNFVRENYGTWKDWVRNTPNAANAAADSNGSRTTLIAAVASVIGVAVLVGVGAIVVMKVRAQKALKHAPRKPPMAIVFTDVESSTTLWERYGSKMGAAIELHNALIRECIEEFHCYEAKIVGDAFVIASASLVDAAMCCLAIQTRLMEAKWPEALKYWKEGSGGGAADAGLFCGLRVRMGIHYAREVEAKLDVVYGRFDFFGPDVNLTARVETAAQGGQILMTEDTYRALVDDADFTTLIGDDAAITKFCSGLELKGVAEHATLYSMVPSSLAARFFEPIPGAVDEIGLTAMSGSETMSQSMQSTASMGTTRHTLRVLTNVFHAFPTAKERELALVSLLSAKNLPQHRGAPLQRRLKVLADAVDAEVTQHRAAMIDKLPAPVNRAAWAPPGDEESTDEVSSATSGPSGSYVRSLASPTRGGATTVQPISDMPSFPDN